MGPKSVRSIVMITAVLIAGASSAQGQIHGHGGSGHGDEGGGHLHRGPAPPPTSIEVPASGVSLAMEDFGGRPVVNVRIDGKGPFPFILDTGAHVTVVDSALHVELALPEASGVRAAPVAGGKTPTIVSIATLAIGGVTQRGVTAVVMSLGRLLSSGTVKPGAGGLPRGVLSALSLPGSLVTFDYPGRRITIRKGRLDKADEQTTFEYPADDVLPTVPIRIAGHDTRVHLDTGSGYGLSIPTRWLDTLPLASEPKAAGKARTHAGEAPTSKASVKGAIQMGRFTLDLADVSFSDVRAGSLPPIGNIGYEVLKPFAVTLDSKNRRIRFVKSSSRGS